MLPAHPENRMLWLYKDQGVEERDLGRARGL